MEIEPGHWVVVGGDGVVGLVDQVDERSVTVRPMIWLAGRRGVSRHQQTHTRDSVSAVAASMLEAQAAKAALRAA